MSFLLGRIVRYAVHRIAVDPQARNAVAKAARGVADKVKIIAGDKDPAQAAGRSFRRAINKQQSERDGSRHQSKR